MISADRRGRIHRGLAGAWHVAKLFLCDMALCRATVSAPSPSARAMLLRCVLVAKALDGPPAIGRIPLDADRVAPELAGGYQGRAGAHERIEHDPTGRAAVLDERAQDLD